MKELFFSHSSTIEKLVGNNLLNYCHKTAIEKICSLVVHLKK